MATNLPSSSINNTDSASKVKTFFDRYFTDSFSYPAHEGDAVIGFFKKRGFDESAAISVSVVYGTAAQISAATSGAATTSVLDWTIGTDDGAGATDNKASSDDLILTLTASADNDLSTFENNDLNLRFHINNLITSFNFSEILTWIFLVMWKFTTNQQRTPNSKKLFEQ